MPSTWLQRAVMIATVTLTVTVVGLVGTQQKGSETVETSAESARTNRLARASSPYLRQHAENPVDWYEWSAEALERARREDKPVFLSIGYAACHWCHVMAHESFADPQTAAVMNAHFVNIKVDREERPDLDEIYMQATLVLNQGQGGWPMSVWLTPDLKPFFAGTYFPPTSRFGRPGFRQLCEKIGEAWEQHRDEIVAQADKLTDIIQQSLTTEPGTGAPPLDLATVDEAAETLAGMFDRQSGGLTSGTTNKFPPSMAMDVMLRSAVRRPAGAARRKQLRELVERTLDHMAYGGIYDQIGGGFHRYSTDVEWHVPHFEKMLYDQALVSRIYVDAYQLTDNPLYERIARETFDYVLRDLQSPGGGFYSSRDADSEGEEGRYYVWTREQVVEVLGKECGEKFCAHYDISESGNWADPHAPGVNKSIPRMLRDVRCCAKMYGISAEEFKQRLANAREKMLAAREQRVPPALDDKVLCEWNGLMIASLARGGRVLGEQKYVDAAKKAAQAILDKQYLDGRLHRSYRDGITLDRAFLSDYANVVEGLLELYEATFDKRWLDHAATLNSAAIEHFWDDDAGGFFFTPDDHEELIARAKDLRDNAVPCGNSVQLMNLLRLAVMLDDQRLRDMAEKQMGVFAAEVRRMPWAAERFLAAVDFAHARPVEIAIVGDPQDADTQALLRVVHETYLPNRVLMLHDPGRPDDSPATPLLENRKLRDGRPAAYVCRDFVCQAPVTTPDALREQLATP